MTPLAASLVARCSFPPPGEAIDCAVSGGPDSLALLLLAAAAGCVATAYHVDHGIRPGSAGEAEVVRGAAERLGCGFVALTVSCGPGPNLEARASEARFAALPEGVATGHTADDQAETVLLNLMRGAGGSGAGAMQPGRRHPILALRRSETAALVAESGLEAVDDPSNRDPAIRRNRVRHELLPLMAAIAERDVVPLVNRFAELVAGDAAVVDLLAGELDPTEVATLRAVPLAVRRGALRRFVQSATGSGYPPDRATVERALQVVDGAVTASEIGHGYLLRRTAGRLRIVAPTERTGDVR